MDLNCPVCHSPKSVRLPLENSEGASGTCQICYVVVSCDMSAGFPRVTVDESSLAALQKALRPSLLDRLTDWLPNFGLLDRFRNWFSDFRRSEQSSSPAVVEPMEQRAGDQGVASANRKAGGPPPTFDVGFCLIEKGKAVNRLVRNEQGYERSAGLLFREKEGRKIRYPVRVAGTLRCHLCGNNLRFETRILCPGFGVMEPARCPCGGVVDLASWSHKAAGPEAMLLVAKPLGGTSRLVFGTVTATEAEVISQQVA